MSRKRTFWSVALLIGTLWLFVDSAEGIVFEIKPPQKFCSSKLALQIGKWRLSNNDLGYSMKHAVLTDSAEGKRKTTSTSLSQESGHTTIDMTEAVYTIELLSGLVGAYLIGYFGGLYISGIAAQLLAPAYDTEPEVLWRQVSPFIYPPVTALGAATGTSLAGLCFRPRGSFGGALIGATLGVAAGIALCRFLDNGGFRLGLLFFSCPSIGAVLGYNYKTFFGK